MQYEAEMDWRGWWEFNTRCFKNSKKPLTGASEITISYIIRVSHYFSSSLSICCHGVLSEREPAVAMATQHSTVRLLYAYREASVALVQHRRSVTQSQLHDLAIRRLRQSRSAWGLRVRLPAQRSGRDTTERELLSVTYFTSQTDINMLNVVLTRLQCLQLHSSTTLWGIKTAPFCFCNNFITSFFIWILIGTHIPW